MPLLSLIFSMPSVVFIIKTSQPSPYPTHISLSPGVGVFHGCHQHHQRKRCAGIADSHKHGVLKLSQGFEANLSRHVSQQPGVGERR